MNWTAFWAMIVIVAVLPVFTLFVVFFVGASAYIVRMFIDWWKEEIS